MNKLMGSFSRWFIAFFLQLYITLPDSGFESDYLKPKAITTGLDVSNVIHEIKKAQTIKNELNHIHSRSSSLGTGSSHVSYTAIPFTFRFDDLKIEDFEHTADIYCGVCSKYIKVTIEQENYYFVYNKESSDYRDIMTSVLKKYFFDWSFWFYSMILTGSVIWLIFLGVFFAFSYNFDAKFDRLAFPSLAISSLIGLVSFRFFALKGIKMLTNANIPFLVKEKKIKESDLPLIKKNYQKYPFIESMRTESHPFYVSLTHPTGFYSTPIFGRVPGAVLIPSTTH